MHTGGPHNDGPTFLGRLFFTAISVGLPLIATFTAFLTLKTFDHDRYGIEIEQINGVLERVDRHFGVVDQREQQIEVTIGSMKEIISSMRIDMDRSDRDRLRDVTLLETRMQQLESLLAPLRDGRPGR